MGKENLGTSEYIKLAFLVGLFIGSFTMYGLFNLIEQPQEINTSKGLTCFPSYYQFDTTSQLNQPPKITLVPPENPFYHPANSSEP